MQTLLSPSLWFQSLSRDGHQEMTAITILQQDMTDSEVPGETPSAWSKSFTEAGKKGEHYASELCLRRCGVELDTLLITAVPG